MTALTTPFSGGVARSEAVVWTELEGAVVMLDTNKGIYYELNAVGSRIWELLEGEPAVASLHSALAAEFDVAADICRGQLEAFLDELSGLGLIRLNPQTADADASS